MEDIIENKQINFDIPTDEEIFKFRKKLIVFLLSSCILTTTTIIVALMIVPTLMNNTGKAAIYLYPQETIEISIKLDKSIKYNNVIPQYKNGWLVEAEPNGYLRDLQPQYTKCKKLPYKEFGFEYSKHACEINKYPYIYWDGIQIKKPLPDKEYGFVVKTENIDKFLSQKADEMLFNETEKKEFVRYWSKTTKEKNWKYVKIYFLENEEVENYLPIYIEPKPENSNRIQIIIKKAKKNDKLEPQKLIPIKRDGYTLVEWGGIIK